MAHLKNKIKRLGLKFRELTFLVDPDALLANEADVFRFFGTIPETVSVEMANSEFFPAL